MMERTAITVTTVGFFDVSGSSGSEKRRKPYVPIFSRTPARITEPAVGASVCASGSHVWNGNIGTLIAKAKKNPQKSQRCSSNVKSGFGDSRMYLMLKVCALK